MLREWHTEVQESLLPDFYSKYSHAYVYVAADLHVGNIGIAVPDIIKQYPDYLISSTYEPILMLSVSSAYQTKLLPAYTLLSCELAALYNKHTLAECGMPRTKILDFGSGAYDHEGLNMDVDIDISCFNWNAVHKSGMQTGCFSCTLITVAPEHISAISIQKMEIEKIPPSKPPTDVWALGTTVSFVWLCFYLPHPSCTTKTSV